jgi:hypothetical protein
MVMLRVMKKRRLLILICIFAFRGIIAPAFAQQVTFSFTGTVQTYIVPTGITNIAVDIQGAGGGNTWMSRGGYGGRVQCTLAVTPGDMLYLNIGGAGDDAANLGASGGYNGGGPGSGNAGGGGGASDIRHGGNELSNRVVVAAGGGGACGATHVASKDYDRGGDGGGLAGENGYSNGERLAKENNIAGKGGGATDQKIKDIRGGSPGKGGEGYADYVGGGGGGGGYYGGSGGNESGGGGGSSYTAPLVTKSVVHTQGYNATGNGTLTISLLATGKRPMPGYEKIVVKKEFVCPKSAER